MNKNKTKLKTTEKIRRNKIYRREEKSIWNERHLAKFPSEYINAKFKLFFLLVSSEDWLVRSGGKWVIAIFVNFRTDKAENTNLEKEKNRNTPQKKQKQNLGKT